MKLSLRIFSADFLSTIREFFRSEGRVNVLNSFRNQNAKFGRYQANIRENSQNFTKYVLLKQSRNDRNPSLSASFFHLFPDISSLAIGQPGLHDTVSYVIFSKKKHSCISGI